MPRRKAVKKIAKHFGELSMENRILIYLADRDRQRGRGDATKLLQNDATEAVVHFSSAYVHWHFEVLANTVSWAELKEFSSLANPGVPLAPGHIALAALTAGLRQRYVNIFKRLRANGEVHVFAEWFRALKGLGGTVVPMLALWTKSATDKPDPIAALSLTESGFARAMALSDAFREVRPWQLHEFMLTVPGFLEKLRGKQ
jgi:hypothetical protein